MHKRRAVQLLSALFYVTYGGLWIHWLRALDQSETEQQCLDIMPRLRTALYAFAWVGVTANVILLCMYLSAGSLVTRYGPGTMGVVGMLLLAIALHIAQILYVRAIERSESTLARRCSEIETFKRGVLIVVSTLFIVVGLFGVFNAGMTNDAVYEEEDTVRQAEVQKQIARILKAIKKGKIQVIKMINSIQNITWKNERIHLHRDESIYCKL